MKKLAATKFDKSQGELFTRALKQAMRESFLLQSSDWPFLVTTGQAKQYAIERFNSHVDRFKQIAKMILNNDINEAMLSEIENIDNCFAFVEPSYFNLTAQTSTK